MKTTGNREQHGSGRIARSLTIDAPPHKLVGLWRDPQVQAQLMAPFAARLSGGGQRVRWHVPLPMARSVEAESRELPGREDDDTVRHEIRTLGGPEVVLATAFRVRPAPADFGTEALLEVDYTLPGGMLADAAVGLAGSAPDLLVGKALRRLKALVEAGEIPTLSRNPSARERAAHD